MYHVILCPFKGDYLIVSTSELFESVVHYGITEIIFSGNYIECEGYREGLYRELSCAELN